MIKAIIAFFQIRKFIAKHRAEGIVDFKILTTKSKIVIVPGEFYRDRIEYKNRLEIETSFKK